MTNIDKPETTSSEDAGRAWARQKLEDKKKQIRELQDHKLLESMQVMGVRLVHLDRAELLGLICYLAKTSNALRKVDEHPIPKTEQ